MGFLAYEVSQNEHNEVCSKDNKFRSHSKKKIICFCIFYDKYDSTSAIVNCRGVFLRMHCTGFDKAQRVSQANSDEKSPGELAAVVAVEMDLRQ